MQEHVISLKVADLDFANQNVSDLKPFCTVVKFWRTKAAIKEDLTNFSEASCSNAIESYGRNKSICGLEKVAL